MRDPYRVLGLPHSASAEDVKSAFRRLAAQHHPDRNPNDPSADARFAELNAAYQILGDPEKRLAWDRFGEAAFRPGGPLPSSFANLGDILNASGVVSEVLGALGVKLSKSGDVTETVELDFLEAARGTDRVLLYDIFELCERCQGHGGERGAPEDRCATCEGRGRVRALGGLVPVLKDRVCPACRGSGRRSIRDCTACRGRGVLGRKVSRTVHVAAGVEDGATLRIDRAGSRPEPERPIGDLLVKVRVKKHPVFERQGQDILCREKIPVTLAILGGAIDVPTLQGHATVQVPPGTQSATILRLRGRGLPTGSGARGDQLVELDVTIPKTLTPRARELLILLAQELDQNPHPTPNNRIAERLRRYFL